MHTRIDQPMQQRIKKWGLPHILTNINDEIIFTFDDESIKDEENYEKGYQCKELNVKFCIYNKTKDKTIFSMDFYKSNPKLVTLIKDKKTNSIKLELLYVHDESLRRKGITGYYIDKLKRLAIDVGAECIYVVANASADNFSKDKKVNALSQIELEEYYKRKSSPEMPIIILDK